MNITLHLINHSTDINNSQVVIFQKNVAAIDSNAVAWQVLDTHPGLTSTLHIPLTAGVGASDSLGNNTQVIDPASGHSWSLSEGENGHELAPSGSSADHTQIAVKNDLPQGSINAQIYKSGKLLATKTGLGPNEEAAFQFKPTIWVGLANHVKEGEIMNSATVSGFDTEVSLEGIIEANLVMNGGGQLPLTFTLEPLHTIPVQTAQ